MSMRARWEPIFNYGLHELDLRRPSHCDIYALPRDSRQMKTRGRKRRKRSVDAGSLRVGQSTAPGPWCGGPECRPRGGPEWAPDPSWCIIQRMSPSITFQPGREPQLRPGLAPGPSGLSTGLLQNCLLGLDHALTPNLRWVSPGASPSGGSQLQSAPVPQPGRTLVSTGGLRAGPQGPGCGAVSPAPARVPALALPWASQPKCTEIHFVHDP